MDRFLMLETRHGLLKCLVMAAVLTAILGAAVSWAAFNCPPYYLKTDEGKIINPISGENADQPYSTRQTCGPCHDYDLITKGYPFQMGWDKVRDDYRKDAPWKLSPGMTGGW